MKKLALLILLSVFTVNRIVAEDIPRDTLRVIDIEEVVIIATPKENQKMRELPTSVTLLSQKDMQAYQVNNIKNLTALVPNIFIPDYGSKLTSAIYIRGIGSRINTPSVGLYVDNVPYIDKSAFDFNYSDIERIDILRGPQGTLYGRNTMGGLIRVHTKSPFSYQGTDVKLSAGNYKNFSGSLTHYHRISEKFAFSAGGFYEYGGGFFENTELNKKADPLSAGGGRIRAIWLPTDNLKLDFTIGYEYSDQGAYAYGLYDKETKELSPVAYNDESSYRRGLFNTGLNIEYQAENFVFSAITGYQNLNDRMYMDQDFSAEDIFDLTQKQKLSTLSEEIIFKSKPNKNWQWTTGFFGFYQWLNTKAPVNFKENGIKTMIEDNTNKIFERIKEGNPRMPDMYMDVQSNNLLIGSNFDTPVLNTAIYHESTFNNLLTEGLSFTAGLRLDYEKTSLKYLSDGALGFDFIVNMMGTEMPFNDLEGSSVLKGKENNDYLQLLPRFALKYDFDKRNNVYALVSKGYRSGGYNVQMFSDILQSELRNSMVEAINTASGERYTELFEQYVPGYGTTADITESTLYKPEYSWNYEIGTHLTLLDSRLFADLAAFYMDTHDQQIARFSENGLGRMTVNAGKSRSYGIEAGLRAQITNSLQLNVNYGYTNATFRNYETNYKPEGSNDVEKVDYSGNYVPFVPQHTFSANGQYTWQFGENKFIRSLTANLGYTGAGKIYWTEANDVSQSFYGTVNARLSAMIGCAQIDVWGRNIFDEEYTSFYFESLGNSFMQRGRPAQVGVDVRFRF